MPVAASLIRTARAVHLYIGVFIAPAVLFFAFSGAMQTFSLHETTKGSDYKPAQWLVVMAQFHKKQTTDVPVRRQPAPRIAAKMESAPVPAPPPPAEEKKRNLLPMKVYFGIVSAALAASTFTGIYMAYKFTRNKIAISATLCAGFAVPLLLLLA